MQVAIDKTDTLRRTSDPEAKRPRRQIFTSTDDDITRVLSSIAINHDQPGEEVGGDHAGARYKVTIEYLGDPTVILGGVERRVLDGVVRLSGEDS